MLIRKLLLIGQNVTYYPNHQTRVTWAPAVWAQTISIECWWKRNDRKNHNLTEMEAEFILGLTDAINYF